MSEAPTPDDQPPLEKKASTDPDAPATPPPEDKPQPDAPTPVTTKKKKKGSKEEGGKRESKEDSKQQNPHRAELKFGEKTPATPAPSRDEQQHVRTPFNPSEYERMTAIYFHHENDLSRSARGVGYTPDHAIPKHGPGITDEVEHLYGPCTLLSDFKYSTWTETVVPLRNHNVVQGFNEMILFLMKLAADPEGQVNHEEAFMATSFLSNIRNDLGEHPPNVLALLEYIDYKTRYDGTEPANPEYEVLTECEAQKRY